MGIISNSRTMPKMVHIFAPTCNFLCIQSHGRNQYRYAFLTASLTLIPALVNEKMNSS